MKIQLQRFLFLCDIVLFLLILMQRVMFVRIIQPMISVIVILRLLQIWMLPLTVRTDTVIIHVVGKPISVLDIVCLVMRINWQQNHSHASSSVTCFSFKLLSDFNVDTLQIISSITGLLARLVLARDLSSQFAVEKSSPYNS